MESATIAAQGIASASRTARCCASPISRCTAKLSPGQANRFYEGASQSICKLAFAPSTCWAEGDRLHSRKLRTFNEPPFR
jgi:AMP nucleosidase